MSYKTIALLSMLLVLGGCAITQDVKPVSGLEGREVCIVANPAVKHEGFIEVKS